EVASESLGEVVDSGFRATAGRGRTLLVDGQDEDHTEPPKVDSLDTTLQAPLPGCDPWQGCTAPVAWRSTMESMQTPAPIQLDPAFENVWDELLWRGSVHVSTDAEALREALGGEPITYYCGFDPTAPSLHLGNLAQLIVMRRLQL